MGLCDFGGSIVKARVKFNIYMYMIVNVGILHYGNLYILIESTTPPSHAEENGISGNGEDIEKILLCYNEYGVVNNLEE